MSFRLTKWYLDCTSEAGDAVIAYWAQLEFGALSLSYSSLLELRGEGPPCSELSLQPVEPPRAEGDRLTWRCEALGLEGTWSSLAPPLPVERLLDTSEGEVRWECRQPLARVELSTRRGATRGLGYTEVLRITAIPWEMPIDELHWGRFVSSTTSLVWVDWRGPHARRVVRLDGAEVAGVSVDDRGLAGPDLRLRFDESRLLRRGALGRTVFSSVPGIDRFAPLRMLATDETKWVSRSTLERAGARVGGHCVHEIVRWPPR